MSPERRQQIERLHQLALQRPLGEREAFLAQECAQDQELKAEVEALLASAQGPESVTSVTRTIGRKGPRHATVQLGRLGKYELRSEIGRGGFGSVYVGWDPMVGRKVAIKVLTAGTDQEVLTRFRNEASSAGKLRHHNIVTIYDFGEEEGLPYIVMELLDGQDLHHIIHSKTPIAMDHMVHILSQSASGLHHAHLNGLVHRDVKPGNIMVLRDYTVKLLDFGIARLMLNSTSRLTQQGMLIGTANYMAPEQLLGSDSDAISDIFALGVVAYELIGGKHPFAAPDPVAVMFAITSKDPPPLRKLAPDCPPALEEVIMRCLSRDRDTRYQSAEDIVLDLEPVLRELRRKRAARLLADAERNIEADDLDAANGLVREILELDPGNAQARHLRDSLQRKLQRRALKPKIDALLSQSRELLDARQFDDAVDRLETAFRLDKTDTRVQTQREKALAAQQEALRAQQLVEDARKAFQERNLTGAYQNIAAALAKDKNHPEAGTLLEDIRAQLDAREHERGLREGLTQARASLMRAAFDEAESLLAVLETQYPDSADLRNLKAEVETRRAESQRRERLLQSLSSARELLRVRKAGEAIGLLEELAKEFPNTAEIGDLLTFARQAESDEKQLQAVAEAEREIDSLLAAHDFTAAGSAVEKALALYPADATLGHLRERVLAAKAAADRERAIQKIAEEGEALLSQSKYAEAADLLDNAAREYGNPPALTNLRGRVEEARPARKTGEEKQPPEQEASAHDRAFSARQTLEQAQNALENGQVDVAAQLASYLETALAGEVDTRDLRAAIAGKAGQGVQPGTGIPASRDQALAEISKLPQKAHRAGTESELAAIVARAEELAGGYPGDNQFKHEAKSVRKAAAAVRAEWKKTQTAADATAAPAPVEAPRPIETVRPTSVRPVAVPVAAPSSRSRMAIAAGAVAVLGIGGLIWKFSGGAGSSALRISTSPAGANVTVGTLTCVTPDCSLKLAPGHYQIKARKPGYAPATADVDIGKDAPTPIVLGLAPLPGRLLVSTNFSGGTVALDGGTAAPLRVGEFTLSPIPDGTHTLEVHSPDGEATLQFQQAPGEGLKILSAPQVKGAQALVISGSASASAVRCDCAAGEVAVDGKAAGQLSAGQLALSPLMPGTHEIRITGPSGNQDSVAALQDDLSLNLFLMADRNAGTLVVETGQDDVRVFLNNKAQPALTQDGLLRLSLPVKQYTVRVEKAGFRSPPAQDVEVKKGQLDRVSFQLTPLEAVLAIRDAVPGTRVAIDGQQLGVVAGDGTLRGNVPPGTHSIDFTRDGYTPRHTAGVSFGAGATVSLGRSDVEMNEVRAPQPPPTPAPTPAPAPPPPVAKQPPPPDPRAVEAEEWNRIRNTKSVDELEAFRRKYPNGANVQDAQRRIEQIEWENLQNNREASAFDAFVRKYPNGAFADQAKRRAEEIDWAGVDKKNADQIRAFLQRRPGAPQTPEANTALASLQQQGDRAAADRAGADRRAINQVLAQYGQDYSAKNIKGLLAIRPSLSGSKDEKAIKDSFSMSRSIALQLTPIKDADVSGDTATVQCRQKLQQTVDRQSLNRDDSVTVSLRRSGGSWVIQDIK